MSTVAVTSILLVHPQAEEAFPNTVLGRSDRQIIFARSGRAALRQIADERPRLVVFGFDLADMEAPELCRTVRSDPRMRDTSLLYLADRGDSTVDLTLAAGCNDVVHLPFDLEQLESKIERLTSIPVRHQFRTLVRIKVRLAAGEDLFWGDSVDVSAGGISLQVGQFLSPGSEVGLRFYLNGDVRPIEVTAEPIWSDLSKSMPRYGLRFSVMADDDRSRIEEYVARMRARELT